jgi:hypothetical protein
MLSSLQEIKIIMGTLHNYDLISFMLMVAVFFLLSCHFLSIYIVIYLIEEDWKSLGYVSSIVPLLSSFTSINLFLTSPFECGWRKENLHERER